MADRVAQDRNLTEDYMINKAEKEEKHDREPEKNGEKPRCTAIILAAGSGSRIYFEITFVISALISSIISGEQFTRSDISRIFRRSFATWQELFLRKKCFIFIPSPSYAFRKIPVTFVQKDTPFSKSRNGISFPSTRSTTLR